MMKALLFSLGLLLVLASCAPSQIQSEPIETLQPSGIPTTGKKTADWQMFFQAEQAYSFKRYDQAANLYNVARSKNPRSRVHLIATYRLGTIYYTLGQYRKASSEFKYLLEKFPRTDLSFDATYNLAASEFQQRNYEVAYETLARLEPGEIEAQGAARASMIYRLTALAATGIRNYSGAIVAYAAQAQLPIGDGHRSKIQSRIDRLLERIESRTELEKLLAAVSEPTTRAHITERLEGLGGSAVAKGGAPVSEEQESFQSGSAGSTADQSHIGVILPLTGRWAPFGKRALDAILLATKKLKDEHRLAFKVFIQDTGSNPLNAASAVDELVYKKKVFAIIGPISWKESVSVAQRAEKLGVVDMLLTLKEGLSAKGKHLFQNGLVARVQLENLVRYCFERGDFRRFAILSPNDSFGRDMAQQFWTLAENNGGKIVAYETYPPNETDFQGYIRSMVGLDRPELRKPEYEAMKAFEEQENAGRRRKITMTLRPVIDFDAIFVPADPKTAAQIAPSLAYLDVVGVPLLGTSEWNNPLLYSRGGKWVEGALFPGGIQPGTQNTRQARFLEDFEKTYGNAADLLAAQAYEAMELLGQAIARTESYNRTDLAQTLAQLKDMPTVLGNVSFDETRVAQRTLPIFKIESRGRITPQ